MLSTTKSFLALTAIAAVLAVGGCDCGTTARLNPDGGNGTDGGGNGTDGGGNGTDGGGNGTDGGGNGTDGGGNGTDGGGNGTDGGGMMGMDGGMMGMDAGPTCLTAADACVGKCGLVSNNCAGIIDCSDAAGVSAGGVACGVGTMCNPLTNACVASDAGTPVCTPTESCASVGQTCGMLVSAGTCGVAINCWPNGTSACPNANQACIPPVPGAAPQCVMGTQSCSGALCNSVPSTCTAQNPTTLSGTVVTPGLAKAGGVFLNRIPVPNAVVYIPGDTTSALPTIVEGVDGTSASCGRCADELFVANGLSVLAGGVTNYRGEFTLSGRIPVGVAFNIVIKVGKWRRVVQIPAGTTTACMNATLSTELTRLNRTSTDGVAGTHLPHIAVSTGFVDEMECVLRNAGIADSEFTAPSGAGRIHLYRNNGARVGTCNGNTTYNSTSHLCSDARDRTIGGKTISVPNWGCWNDDGNPRAGCSWSNQSVADTTLYQNASTINGYDMVVWDCEGAENFHTNDNPRILNYVNGGGRMFASHYAYVWIEGNSTLDNSADWGDTNDDTSDTGLVSMPTGTNTRARANAVKSPAFRDWLDYLGALSGTTAGLPLENPASPQFTITDPRDRAGTNSGPSTDEWMYRTVGNGVAVQQLSFNTPYGAAAGAVCGRVAYTGFHVAATDNNDTNDYFPTTCTDDGDETLTSQELSLLYMLFDLNSCVSTGDPVTPPTCTPLTAADVCPGVNDACNYLSDGCGGVVDCGSCSPGYFCSVNSCIMAPPPCVPQTCAQLNASYVCGQFPDGCGGIADGAMADTCGTCVGTNVCGPNGTCVASCTPNPNPCGASTCGSSSNGCGGTVFCGPYPMGACAPGDTCVTEPMSGTRTCQYVIE